MFSLKCLNYVKDKIKPMNRVGDFKEKKFMNAGRTIVGYVTKPNGSPISDAEIWISRADEFGSESETKPVVKTDSRGYFQLTFGEGAANITEVGGNLNISVGARTSERANSKGKIVAESRFRVTGYLIGETLKPDA